MKVSDKKVIEFLLIAYVITSLIIPSAIVNKLIFVVIVIITLVFGKKLSIKIVAPGIIFGIFLYGYFIGILNRCDTSLARQFLLSTLILFLIFPICSFEIDMTRLIKIGGIVLLWIDYMYILYAIANYSFNIPINLNAISNFVLEILPNSFFEFIEIYGSGAIGYRGFYKDINIMVHLGSIAFLFLPTCVYFDELLKSKKKRKLLFVIFSFIAMFCSTSRALMLVTFATCLFLFILNKKGNLKNKFIIIFLITILMMVILLYLISNTSVFDVNEISNNIKLDHISSTINFFSIKQIFIGDGLASYFYSSVLGRNLAHTEITLLDFCRYFGLPLAILVYLQLLLPAKYRNYTVKKATVEDKKYIIIFVAYLIISLTNPVLFNSVGTIVILWYWSKVMLRKKTIR